MGELSSLLLTKCQSDKNGKQKDNSTPLRGWHSKCAAQDGGLYRTSVLSTECCALPVDAGVLQTLSAG